MHADCEKARMHSKKTNEGKYMQTPHRRVQLGAMLETRHNHHP